MHLFTSTVDDYCNHPISEFPAPIRAFRSLVIGVLWVFGKVMWRCDFERKELIAGQGGGTGSVIICNHTSMAEVVVIYTELKRMGRSVRPIAKSEFYKNKLIAWAFSRVGAISVERGTADIKSLRAAQHALKRGEDILIFPEGTRVRSDDQPAPIHGGFALIAQMAKAAIAPMAVCGFRDVTPNGKHVMRPVKCWMRAGEPVSASDAPADLKRTAKNQWVEDEAVRRMFEIRDDLRREHPGRF